MKKQFVYAISLGLFFSACTIDEETLITNTITEGITVSTTWTADNVWIIDGGISITADLIIEPGTIVKFNEGSYLYVGYGAYGSLKANGTIEKPILFTSNASSPSAGDWNGILFYQYAGNKSTLDHCIIEYAGNSDSYDGALYIEYASISLQNTTISNSATNGVYNYNGGFVSFTGNIITNCQGFPLVLPAQTVHIVTSDNVFDPKGVLVNNNDIKTQKVTWKALSTPYILSGLNINDDGELTIEAGATLLFKAGASVYIGYGSYGKLVANGTTEHPVIFSSSASSPSPGDWQGINFYQYTANGSVLNNCIVSYGGAIDGNGANVYSEYNASKLTITNSEIAHSQNCGISTYSSTPLISAITYVDNGSNECGDLVP